MLNRECVSLKFLVCRLLWFFWYLISNKIQFNCTKQLWKEIFLWIYPIEKNYDCLWFVSFETKWWNFFIRVSDINTEEGILLYSNYFITSWKLLALWFLQERWQNYFYICLDFIYIYMFMHNVLSHILVLIQVNYSFVLWI